MSELEPVFARLRALFQPYAARAVLLHDEPGRYYLATHEVRAKDGYRTWFGGVEVKKGYVSTHLIPVYAHPELLETLSPGLRKRMQGKSCFNFKTVGEVLFKELEGLIARAAARFETDGRFSQPA